MAALVLKAWQVSDQPLDRNGSRIVITGREGGLVAWLLALAGVDPTTSIRVSPERIEFVSSSLAGTNHRLLPLISVCSTFFGYHKPWKQALAAFVVLFWLLGALAFVYAQSSHDSPVAPTIVAFLLAAALATLQYFLNRTLTLGFVENSGVLSAIRFRRSVIEGVDVDEREARSVCEFIQALVEYRLKTLSHPS